MLLVWQQEGIWPAKIVHSGVLSSFVTKLEIPIYCRQNLKASTLLIYKNFLMKLQYRLEFIQDPANQMLLHSTTVFAFCCRTLRLFFWTLCSISFFLLPYVSQPIRNISSVFRHVSL